MQIDGTIWECMQATYKILQAACGPQATGLPTPVYHSDVPAIAVLFLQKSRVQKMERITHEFGAMSELQQYQLQNAPASSQAVFEACDIRTFC